MFYANANRLCINTFLILKKFHEYKQKLKLEQKMHELTKKQRINKIVPKTILSDEINQIFLQKFALKFLKSNYIRYLNE